MSYRPDFGAVLPEAWPKRVRSAIVHVCSLAYVSLVTARGWTANHRSAHVRQETEIDGLRQEVALLREELRIKDGRMLRVPGPRRPHYPPTERLNILQLRALRGWSLTQTAQQFQLSVATVSSWMRRLDEEGPGAVVQVPTPVNKFPDLVTLMVQRLKWFCPLLGHRKIAHMLCRVGLQMGASTVRRMLREERPPRKGPRRRRAAERRIASQRPHDVWLSDLTTQPTTPGQWIPWFPYSLPQRWPFCWWVAVVADHYSRRILGFEVFRRQPSAEAMRGFLERVMREVGARPALLVTDLGAQFRGKRFRGWCRSLGVRQRFGFLGEFGGIALVERLVQTVKNECTRRLLIPLLRHGLRRELSLFRDWYNGTRPHEGLGGATPDERYGALAPRSFDVGARVVVARVGGEDLCVRFVGGRPHLPSVALERAA